MRRSSTADAADAIRFRLFSRESRFFVNCVSQYSSTPPASSYARHLRTNPPRPLSASATRSAISAKLRIGLRAGAVSSSFFFSFAGVSGAFWYTTTFGGAGASPNVTSESATGRDSSNDGSVTAIPPASALSSAAMRDRSASGRVSRRSSAMRSSVISATERRIAPARCIARYASSSRRL